MGAEYDKKAVDAFELNLKRKEEEQVNDKELTECLLFLSRYYKKIGNVERAIELARRLSDLQGVEKDEANKLLQELNLMPWKIRVIWVVVYAYAIWINFIAPKLINMGERLW